MLLWTRRPALARGRARARDRRRRHRLRREGGAMSALRLRRPPSSSSPSRRSRRNPSRRPRRRPRSRAELIIRLGSPRRGRRRGPRRGARRRPRPESGPDTRPETRPDSARRVEARREPVPRDRERHDLPGVGPGHPPGHGADQERQDRRGRPATSRSPPRPAIIDARNKHVAPGFVAVRATGTFGTSFPARGEEKTADQANPFSQTMLMALSSGITTACEGGTPDRAGPARRVHRQAHVRHARRA